MSVEVERLTIEVLLPQPPPPPHYDLLPRRSPAAGTALDEPRVLHTKIQQTELDGTFPFFQAGVDGFLRVDCTRIPEQRANLLSHQADVGANHETTTRVQLAACQEFVKVPRGRQQRGTASTEQIKQFDPVR